jgi:succinate dehydrogenase/fumarate reductase flavoprotein subunit
VSSPIEVYDVIVIGDGDAAGRAAAQARAADQEVLVLSAIDVTSLRTIPSGGARSAPTQSYVRVTLANGEERAGRRIVPTAALDPLNYCSI